MLSALSNTLYGKHCNSGHTFFLDSLYKVSKLILTFKILGNVFYLKTSTTVLMTHVATGEAVWLVSTLTRANAWRDTLGYIVRLVSHIDINILISL